MATIPGQHPNDLHGVVVDTPPRESSAHTLKSGAQLTSSSGYHRMRCTNLSTGEFLGWLATSGNNVYLETDPKSSNLAACQWRSWGADLYLAKDTSPSDRLLGLGWNSYACWGAQESGGWHNPIIYNADHTISLKEAPNRKLYGPYGNQWVCWTGEESNQNIIKCDMEP